MLRLRNSAAMRPARLLKEQSGEPVLLTTLTRENASAVFDTLVRFWDQAWDDQFRQEFLDWRYVRRPGGEPVVAICDRRCVAILDVFLRPYLIEGEVRLVRELCDWYCVPEMRGSLGTKLPKFVMRKGDPVVAVPLPQVPQAAIALTSRLKWLHVADAQGYVLRISVRQLVSGLLRRMHLGNGGVARFIPSDLSLAALLTRRRPFPAGGEVCDLDEENYPELTPSREYALSPIVTREYYRWLSQAPSQLGRVVSLVFSVRGVAQALTISRIEPTQVGTRAKIIHLQFADLSQQTVDWVVAETVARLIENGAETIYCRSSCPHTGEALRKLHFLRTEVQKVYGWWPQERPPSGPVNITLLHADEAMIPSLINK